LEHRVRQQNQHVPAAAEGEEPALQPIGEPEPEPPGAHQDREDIHQHAIAQRGEQEGPEVLVVDESVAQQVLHEDQEENEDVAAQLDQRAEILEDPERGQREPADPPVLLPPQHGSMVAERLAQPTVPAPALLPERLHGLRHFGPGYGVRQKRDAPILQLVAHEAVQAYDDLHVLTDRTDASADILLGDAGPDERRQIPAGADHGFLLED